MNKLYNVSNEKHILKEISKLQPLNYNQFRRWRRFDTPNKPLHKYSALIDKIKNGDYDFSHYYWQAKYAEIEINEIFDDTYPDAALFNEKASLHRARRKRLFDDFGGPGIHFGTILELKHVAKSSKQKHTAGNSNR